MTQLSRKEFDYSILDEITARFLKEKEMNMRHIVKDVAPKIGKELKEAQDKLASHGYGCFEQWYESLGFKRQTVYNYINAYSFLQVLEDRNKGDIADTIPVYLMYEAGKKSAHPEAVQAVIDGKVTSWDQYKALEKKLRETEERAAKAENEARHWQGVAKSAQNQPPRVVKETVEVVPDRIKKQMEEKEQEIRTLKAGFQEVKTELEKYKLRNTDDFDAEQARREREKLQHEADISTLQLRVVYKTFVEKAAITPFMQGAIATASESEKQRLHELATMAQAIINQTLTALRGRKEIEVI